jgi:hypothetical protein
MQIDTCQNYRNLDGLNILIYTCETSSIFVLF